MATFIGLLAFLFPSSFRYYLKKMAPILINCLRVFYLCVVVNTVLSMSVAENSEYVDKISDLYRSEIVKVIIRGVMARSAAADDINDHMRIKRAVIGSINCAGKAQRWNIGGGLCINETDETDETYETDETDETDDNYVSIFFNMLLILHICMFATISHQNG